MNLWEETSVVPLASQVSVVRYDPYKPLVWVGDVTGMVFSFYTPLLLPYTSFVASNGPVLDLQISEKFVLCLSNDGVKTFHRQGTLAATNRSAIGGCMLLLNDSEFLVGLSQKVKRYSIEPEIKETGFFHLDSINEPVSVKFMKLCSPDIALGLSDGTIQIVEPFTFDNVMAPAVCHPGSIIDLDARKNLVVTCGLTTRKFGRIFPDVFASCFDTKAKRIIQPFTSSSGASFVRLHPKSPNHAVVLSASGALTFMDNKNPNNVSINQMVLHGTLVGMDISSSGHALIIAENNCLHHWYANPTYSEDDNKFKGLQVPTAEIPADSLKDYEPLSKIGLPYFQGTLLSEWSPNLLFEVGNPTPNWSTVQSSLITPDNVRANGNRGRSSSTSVPRFLSEKERLGLEETKAFADLMKTDDSASRGKVPKIWRQMHIHYSKFGVDDFDFQFYNSTKYAGLETLSENPHLNSLLQLYRWCQPIYNSVLAMFARFNYLKITTIGELAIVLDMLSKAEGNHFRATNFVDTLKYLNSKPVTELHNLLITEIANEQFNEIKNDGWPLTSFLQMSCKEFGSCGYINFTEQSKATHLVADDPTLAGIQGCFSQTSLDSVDCPKCKKQHSVVVSQRLNSEPEVLFVAVKNKTRFDNYKNNRTIVNQFGIQATVNQKMVLGVNSDDYILRGYIAEVSNEGQKHSVAVINTGNGWHLFNDFLVTPISDEEALDLSCNWKTVTLLMYMSKEAMQSEFNDGWKLLIDTRLLYNKQVISGNRDEARPESEMLKVGEKLPEEVSLDAEFVLLKNEVAEMHSDGSKTLLSPKKLGLARISVIRNNESVVIDDWVQSDQPILDYLTTYSGVEPGDLDPNLSNYALVTRSVATRRLWILLNSGTKFIGHALINDFRTINLFVPKEQVVDTINLYYDRDRTGLRRLSLKFLMWAVLDSYVQTGNHDSVQDALSALQLYKEWKVLKEEGVLEDMLTDLARKGLRNNYKVPNDERESPRR